MKWSQRHEDLLKNISIAADANGKTGKKMCVGMNGEVEAA